MLYAFDLIEHDGDDLRDLPLIRLARLLGHVAGGHRVEADGCALSQRPVKDVGQVEDPGERGGAPGARGGVALDPPTVIRCMNSAAST